MSRTSTVTQAQQRATVSSILASDTGKDFTTEEIATALGASARTAGQILAHMAKGGLIHGPIKLKGDKRKRWAWPTDSAGEVPPATPTPPKLPKTEEVELLVGGRLIIVGTNPRTGRLRITIET